MHRKEKKTFVHHLIKSLVCLYTSILIYENVLCCEYFIDAKGRTCVRCVNSVNLTDELAQLRENMSLDNEHLQFDYIEIYSPIDEIPSNVFQDISFRHILIYNSSSLKRIHQDAFRGDTFTQHFTCFQNFVSQLENDPPDYDLYQAIRSLTHLQKIYLSLANNKSHEILDNTFTPTNTKTQQYLWFVEWYGYFTISRIGSDVFYGLPNITSIVFKYATVDVVGANAFRLKRNMNKPLNITFHRTNLTENSFEVGAFANINREVRLDLTNNFIGIIDEKIFGPFFSANENNSLILGQNPLRCSQKDSFRWLSLNKINLEKRISKGYCENGRKLWEVMDELDQPETTTSSQTEPTVTERTTVNDFETITVTGVMETDATTETIAETTIDIETEPEANKPGASSSPPDHSSTSSTSTVSSTGCQSSICSITRPSPTLPSSTTSINEATRPLSTSTTSKSTTSAHHSTESHSSTASGDQNSDQTLTNINQRVEELIDETKSEHSLNTTDGLKDVLDEIQTIQTSLDSMNGLDFETALNITSNILNVLSNLLNQNDAWIKTTGEERTSIASQLLEQVQFTSFFLSCTQNISNKTTDRITNDNIISEIYRNFDKEIHFQANDSSILIPQEVIHWNGITECGNSSFAALIARLDEYLNESLSSDQNINTQVISYSQSNRSETIHFNQTWIKFSLKHKNRLQFGDQMLCAFWNFSSMDWSTNGCKLSIADSNRDITVCECNHLTNFAAIMDISNRETDDSLKSILTNVFCGISLFCLVLTIWLLLKPKRNKANTITNRLVRTRTIITLNLAVMLCVADILIIFGMDRKYNQILCKAMSAILLYSLLSSFSWMLLEGYHLYKMTVQVFNSNTRKLFLFLFGYGVPIVIFFIGFLIIWIQDSVFFDALIGDYFCWISSAKYPGHIWLIAGPALIAIVFNILMLTILVRKVYKRKTNQNNSKCKLRIKQIFGVTSLLFNLGITWLSFILYIKQFGSYFSYFSYVFIVLNGSQGIFIFVYHLMIYLSKSKKLKNLSLRTSLKLTLSLKWSTKTTQTQLGDN